MAEEIRVLVSPEGVEETQKQIEDMEGPGPEDGDGEMPGLGEITSPLEGMQSGIGGMMKPLMGMLKLLGPILAALGPLMILAKMEPVKKMMEAFMNIIQAFMVPLVKALLTLLRPVLRWFMDLLPDWLDFWSDPIGNLSSMLNDFGSWLWAQIKKLPGLILKGIKTYLKIWMKIGEIMLSALLDFGSWLVSKFSDILSNIFGSIPGFAGGGVMRGDGLAFLHDRETVRTPEQEAGLIEEIRRLSRGPDIKIEGDAAGFINVQERQRGTRR